MADPQQPESPRSTSAEQGPAAVFLTQTEAKALRAQAEADSLIGRSIRAERAQVDAWLRSPVSVPGSGAGGGVEHEQHKRNYLMIFAAGRQHLIWQQPEYAKRIAEVLSVYAERYTTLPFAKPYSHNPPGRLFHQILNEHMWLLFAAAGYSCVRPGLPEALRQRIDEGVFAPMVEMFTRTYRHHFDIIHNHGMWACAAVGVAGIACERRDWLELAVRGQFGDSETAGFLAQLANLFSPSGYYEEGPYYQRFAIQPMLFFAEAIERAWPELGIYRHHDEVVRRGFYAAFLPSFPNGALVPLNDAIKPMNIKSLGFVLGASFMYRRYEADARLLWLANLHGQVWPDAAGVALSDAVHTAGAEALHCELPSVELLCGPKGDKGAVGILRAEGRHHEQAVLTFDAGSHGLAEHAHFDALTLGYFARGQEVLRDYGCVRWINIEPKGGGAYLPENVSFAKQTIAHNTVSVDGRCQHEADAELAVANPSHRLAFHGSGDAQWMRGETVGAYPGVAMRRTVALLRHADFEHPLLVDLFAIEADADHVYDYALYYDGQVVRTDFDYAVSRNLSPLGTDAGYQHLWRVGAANLPAGRGLFSWLQKSCYHSLSFATSGPSEFIFTRIGANDPKFNLRAEPGLMLRQAGRDVVFASVLETHGDFDESREFSQGARGRLLALEIEDGGARLRLHGTDADWVVELGDNVALRRI
ncbi:heparinase II/III domain-containing protein [Uliginosibacterium sp. H1]|uniref:heparinase II/III domain-containing protein n=1 Tax=Uliginosibacterium sp. H1 TaxID=3114757 RepID=UPI002E199A4F|nr:heparinase II/III family protein [Uliginosibacterium sp. H1]